MVDVEPDEQAGTAASTPDDYEFDYDNGVTTVFADAAIAEVIGDTIQISFVERSREILQATWQRPLSQPSSVGLHDRVAEVARIRLVARSANDLAMNILLELARHLDLDHAALDRNIAILRSAKHPKSEGEA